MQRLTIKEACQIIFQEKELEITNKTLEDINKSLRF